MSERYRESEAMLKRALKSIPLGSQTFSKSKTQYPHGVSPFFIQKANGSRVWDVDGNEYVDFINSLAAVTLGYNDPDIVAAVKAQLDEGIIFSLPHPIEVDVAESIISMVPCAEMVRYGKNGSDATAGAIRLARAYTRRDHVAVCGYHGWQDWYIGSTPRNLGVPESTRHLTHPFVFNDLNSLHTLFKEWPDQIAAVILEPAGPMEPQPGFLEAVKDLTHQHNAILIFDETVTGFRLSNGGAQQLYGVTPDLATFGKGIANGYPLSVVAGSAKVMRLMEEIFFSFTFGGEALSLAAARATLAKLVDCPVVETLRRQGEKVMKGTAELIRENQLDAMMSISGHPSWSFLTFRESGEYSPWQMKTFFLQEIFSRGILTLGTHNMSYSHSDTDIARLLAVYGEVFPLLRQAVQSHTLDQKLRCAVLTPLFRLR